MDVTIRKEWEKCNRVGLKVVVDDSYEFEQCLSMDPELQIQYGM